MGRGFGINATVAHTVARTVAAEAERRGYTSFWSNDPVGADGLATLAAAAAVTSGIRLGVGVIPLDRRPPESIIRDIARLGLPQERLLLGVGAGGDRKGLQRVREGIAALRQGLSAQILVAALGPNMCRLVGEAADGVVFNWLTPEYAAISGQQVLAGAAEAGRSHPLLTAHVRCALLPQAQRTLEEQAGRYSSIPQYAANFRRMRVSARETVVSGVSPAELQARLAEYTPLLDETIVRAITADDRAESILELLDACAPPAE